MKSILEFFIPTSTRNRHLSNHRALRRMAWRSPSWRVGLMALGFHLAGGGWLIGQVDDFNDGNDQGWERYDPISQSGLGGIATFSFPGGDTYRIQSSPSPAPGAVGPGRAGSLRTDRNYGDFYISVDIVDWDPALNQVFGLMARLDDVGLGATDGYAFTYDPVGGDLDLTSFTDEDPDGGGVPVGGEENAVLVRGRHYRMVFSSIGQEFTGAIYELPDVENPLARIVGVDSRFGSGYIGLLNYDNSSAGNGRTDVTYDNFAAFSAPPPRLTFLYAPETRDMALFWPAASESFILQATPSLSPSVWTNIPPPYDLSGDMFFYPEPTVGKSGLYFRLFSE